MNNMTIAVVIYPNSTVGHEHSHSHDELPNVEEVDSHEGHSHMEDLRQRINILKQAGEVFGQASSRSGDADDLFE